MMRITHQNYLLVEYSQLDSDKFYVEDVVEVKTEHFEICGTIHGLSSQRIFLIYDECWIRHIWFSEIISIRKVEK